MTANITLFAVLLVAPGQKLGLVKVGVEPLKH